MTLPPTADTSWTTSLCARQWTNFAGEAPGSDPCRDVFIKNTTRSASGAATGRSRTAFTTEKIAVLAPMPSVSAAIAASVNARALISVRSAYFRSFSSPSMTPPMSNARGGGLDGRIYPPGWRRDGRLARPDQNGYNICGYDSYWQPDARSRTEERIGGADHPVDRRTACPSWLRDQQADRDALGRAAAIPRRITLSASLSAGRTRVAARAMGREAGSAAAPVLR